MLSGPYERGEKGPGTWWLRVLPQVELEGVVHRPSIAGWSKATLTEAPADDAVISVAPEWVCEFASLGEPREELGVRMRAFAKACVPHAWVGDPVQQMLVIYERDGEKWKRTQQAMGDAQGKFAPFVRVAIELTDRWPVVKMHAQTEGDEGGGEADGGSAE